MTSRQHPAADLPFTAIEQLRAHEYVAEQIRRQIGLGLLAPAQPLPPERELMTLFGVGRMTVQLALGLLEADRLVETRRGRNGGTFVIGPRRDRATMDHRLIEARRHADRIREALDMRQVIEPAAAARAAERRTRAELRAVQEAAEEAAEADGDAEFMRHDTRFHLAVAQAAHNPLFYELLERVRLDLNVALVVLPESQLWHDRSNQEHRAIVEAITGRDADAAHERMHEHTMHTDKSVAALLKTLDSTWR